MCASLARTLVDKILPLRVLGALRGTQKIVYTTNSVAEQVEEDDTELIPESPCFDAKLFEVMSSSSLGSQLVGEAYSAK